MSEDETPEEGCPDGCGDTLSVGVSDHGESTFCTACGWRL